MFKNYLKIAWRNLKRNKSYTFINITGLAVAIAACLLIGLWVQRELSYDSFNKKAARIYRVNLQAEQGQPRDIAVTPNIVGPLLTEKFSGVEKAVRLNKIAGVGRYRDRIFRENKFFFADSSFFNIFTFPFIRGNAATALSGPDKVVITRSAAQRYFGKENPLGKTLIFNKNLKLEVTGVIQDVPSNSHFQFDFIASWTSQKDWQAHHETWGAANFYTYLLLNKQTDASVLQQKIDHLLTKLKAAGPDVRPLSLMPLMRIHLYANLAYALDPTGDIRYVYIFSLMAILILLIACINYMNLATAFATERTREIGMRKVLGASRGRLALQLYGETAMLVSISLFLAAGLAQLSLPLFNELTGASFALSDIPPATLLSALVGIGLLVSIIAGSYPALSMSLFKPSRVLKGTSRATGGAERLRKGLVIFQFAVAVFLIAGTFIIRSQLSYLQNKNLGFDKNHVVMMPTSDPALKDAFLQNAGVQHITLANQYPGAIGWTSYAVAEGRPDTVLMKGFITDKDVVPTLGLKIVAGHDFPAVLPNPDSVKLGYRYLLNKTAVRAYGWTPKQALGKQFNMLGGRKGRIIGVVKDFNFASLQRSIEPMAIWYHPNRAQYMLARIAPGNVAGTMAFLKDRWEKLSPEAPFTYHFLDDTFDALYRNQRQVSRVFSAFAVLAIIIACLGLFGLSAFAAERRTKEIGVRKVLGATVANIVGLLSKDFLKLVAIGFVIAVPIGWYAMHRWLQSFAYKITITPWIFLGAGGLALLIALATISWQSIRAALANPVDALRSE